MNKKVVFVFICLTILLYMLSLMQWLDTKKHNEKSFLQVIPKPSSFPEQACKEEEFIAPAGDFQVHAASITELPDGALAAVWYGGKYEGSPDTQIYFATRSLYSTHSTHSPHSFLSQANQWSVPRSIVSRESAAKELNRYLKKIGNPLLFTAGENRLLLFFVSVSIGGWSGSSVNIKMSLDRGKTWTRSQRLTLSPFFNISELVRNNPLPLANGQFIIPIYHEFMGVFSELLWFQPGIADTAGDNFSYFKTRLTNGTKYLQPSLVSIAPHSAVVFYRSHYDNSRVAVSYSDDTGRTWAAPQDIDLPNPGSGLNAIPLSSGRILLAFNDSLTHRDNLTLAVSDQGPTEGTGRYGKKFQKWQRAAILENTPGREFSYPYMIRTADGKIHLVYTWQRKRIKHITFNEAWINEKVTLNDE